MSSLPNTLMSPIEIRASLHGLLTFLFPPGKFSSGEYCASTRTAVTPEFELFEHVGAGRADVEKFISQRFAESFGSRVEAFMPRLFSLRNREGDICGAFGLRSANQKLFLEQYLDTPVNRTITTCTGSHVERRSIVEVGHFSGKFPGVVRAMIGLLTERLHHEGFAWVVFTGTANLRNAFTRMGLSPIDIQAATVDRLPVEERAAWGQYYEHAPRVLIGNIQKGYRAMHRQALPDRLRSGSIS
ncbi:MAG: thermostable hemolysin [Propionivibrio sp.]|uniref:thermostable hemolysin n=1 Tax=Propionivibrio sp. TaxID=2212460 RepID=UPI001A4331A8|nr:thermostable hemolysin [Propionivibrio sp.]MBL8414718.1 thermostable hemolysin [Propionivibrio sp.]